MLCFAYLVVAIDLHAQSSEQTMSVDTPAVKRKKVKEKPVRYVDKDLLVEQKQHKTTETTKVKKKNTTPETTGGFTSVLYYENQDTTKQTSKIKKQKAPKGADSKKSDDLQLENQSTNSSVKQTDSKYNKDLQQGDTSNTQSNQEFSIIKSDNSKVTYKPKKEKPKQEVNIPQEPYNPIPVEKPLQAPVIYTRDQIAAMLLDTGNYYLEKGRFMRAHLYFDSLTQYYQNTFQYKFGYYFKAKCKMGMQDDVGAVNDFNYFILLDGCKSNFCTDTRYNLGVLKFKLGQFEQALFDLNEAAKDSSYKNYKFIFFYRAFCYAQQLEYIKAIQDLTRFLNLDNAHTYSTAEAIYYRGFYKTQLQDYRGAIKDYDAAIEMYLPSATGKNPNLQHIQKLIEVYIVRGLAKSQLKKYDEAIADYNLVIKLNPKYATAYRLKALDEIKKGDIEQGCLDLSRAGELGSNEAYSDIKQYCK